MLFCVDEIRSRWKEKTKIVELYTHAYGLCVVRLHHIFSTFSDFAFSTYFLFYLFEQWRADTLKLMWKEAKRNIISSSHHFLLIGLCFHSNSVTFCCLCSSIVWSLLHRANRPKNSWFVCSCYTHRQQFVGDLLRRTLTVSSSNLCACG